MSDTNETAFQGPPTASSEGAAGLSHKLAYDAACARTPNPDPVQFDIERRMTEQLERGLINGFPPDARTGIVR